MKENKEDFLNKLLSFFPNKEDEYNAFLLEYVEDDEGMETVIIEDIFMPDLVDLLEKNTDTERLREIFDYFETVSNNADEELENIFSITTLEILGNDEKILETARTYMGPKTVILQYEADRHLGRIVRPPSL
ncbi:MAG: resolvase [Lachnospiraceae bacterium]|nr:resolvase [Lachnospiraceae bacterium]